MFVHLVLIIFYVNKVAIAYESEMLKYIRDISILDSFHGIISLGLDPNPSRHRRFRTARPRERSISAGDSAPV